LHTKRAYYFLNTHKIEVISATNQQASVIAQLYELYTYEMTDLADFDINDNGFYGYDDLPLYWQDKDKYPYLIWVNKKLAGFALIQKGSPIEHHPDIWDVAEFFIMRKFRGKGLGEYVAHHLWTLHSGHWQVRVWNNNKVAHAFWDKAINNFTKEKLAPKKICYQGHDGLLVYRFQS